MKATRGAKKVKQSKVDRPPASNRIRRFAKAYESASIRLMTGFLDAAEPDIALLKSWSQEAFDGVDVHAAFESTISAKEAFARSLGRLEVAKAAYAALEIDSENPDVKRLDALAVTLSKSNEQLDEMLHALVQAIPNRSVHL